MNNFFCRDAYLYQQTRMAHWDKIARQMDVENGWGAYYHQRMSEIYRFLVAPGSKVLEIGCGQGDLLGALKPERGVGVDFSHEMLKRGKQKHPELLLIQADAHDLSCMKGKYDIIIFSDLINDVWDIQTVFEQASNLAMPHTRIIINSYSKLWELPLSIAIKLGLATSKLEQNWVTVEDTIHLLLLADFELIQHWEDILWPLSTPGLTTLANRYLVKFWPIKMLALTNFIVARLKPSSAPLLRDPVVSVIVPARNEAGNIPHIVARTPEMGAGTELIFVEGHSTDNTYAVIEETIADHPERRCKLLRQTGVEKGDAVRLGFSRASGDIFLILDADLSVPPEVLPRFIEPLISGKADLVNGVRLVYPMDKRAMRFINLLGNKLFSLAFSWLLGQPVKDTLCGTKALLKSSYHLIEANRSYFGEFDPFGDFDMLFGASKLNLKIIDLPIRYRERTYGDTNIKRWSHGWLLLKMVFLAARRIKFT